ncbi:MAG: 3-phosphoshikimate 1-carboxyvinyltransferase [Oscillospiraceae bacterium]|nr:3-phosphoshikimate 1-carboxyvinyltransferase [Oscillospiraceae bacterium]
MDRKVNGSSLGGEVRAIPSKSQAHRMLICSALAEGESSIYCPAINEDIEATAGCLGALGARLTRSEGSYTVLPVGGGEGGGVLACGESGSTLRFLLPVACALGAEVTFEGKGRLPQRPMAELCEALREGGAEVSADNLPIKVSGTLKAGTYKLPANVSSQYISGLMFALPLLEGESVIELDAQPESEPYIDMTIGALKLFGVEVIKEDNSYRIPAGQKYVSPGRAEVEGDWSNAAFWLCAGAIGRKPVSVTGMNMASAQGDRAVVETLLCMGAKVEEENGILTVYPSKLRGIEIDAKNIPDLVPVLAVTAATAEGETRIYNAGRLRIKESDRIKTTSALLRSLGAAAEETDDGLIVRGGKLHGGETESYGDHRIAMAAAVAACAADGEVLIRNSQAVAKSYPAFFEDYAALGGIAKEIV